MTQVRTVQVDQHTGEIMDGAQLALIFPKRTNGFQQAGWLAMAQGPLIKLAKANLGGQALKAFMLLCGKLDFENWVNVSQAELANELSMNPSHMSRAIAKLIAEGVILKGPSVGNRKTYRLDPAYGWKGSAKNHRDALNQRVKHAGLAVHEGGRK